MGNYLVIYLMVDVICGMFYFFFFGIIMYYSGVIVWKECDVKMDEFYDVFFFFNWVLLVVKFLVLVGMVVVVLVLGIIIGVVMQVGKGYINFELGVYLREFLIYDFSGFILIIMLVLLI